jgi:ribosome-binding protein aMBF1 (putative translation factor)
MPISQGINHSGMSQTRVAQGLNKKEALIKKIKINKEAPNKHVYNL